MATDSLWSATASMPVYPTLAADLTVEVCVVGAGIAGLTTAYLLARQGVSVAVLEAFGIGAGETSHTTAHIAVPDEGYSSIEQSYGPEAARTVAQSFAAAGDFIEATVAGEQIDCNFERVDGYLLSCADDPRAALRREFDAATRAAVRVINEESLPAGTFAAGPCLRFPQQAQFHPLRYVAGLARALEQHRGAIFTGTRALAVEERADSVTVRAENGSVSANAAVIATNTPFSDRLAIHIKQYAYQSYVIAAVVKRGAVPAVLIWDDGDPYHYVRTAPACDGEHDLLLVGGADHRTGQEPYPQLHHAQLEAWLRKRFPDAGPIAHRWSGQVMEPLDGIAFLGRHPGSRSVYVITGDSGNGMSYGTFGGLLVSDLLMGRQNEGWKIYSPSRKPLKQAAALIREQSNIAAQYSAWISRGDVASAAGLAPGEGALIRAGLKKVAVYRDDDGSLHAYFAACTHLGCVVQWNPADRTWDCPCHGSRFSAFGTVLHGPAVSPLAPIEDDQWAALIAAPRAGARQEQRPKS
jgi:glycine/D-amino acid oxidase-like deaminating enzyme/nitrite reductase/ring-hydroxylating ferredoxin subunit